MLTRAQAIDSVRAKFSADFDVLEDRVIEKEYGWVIFSQTKQYISTGDPTLMAVGSGGILVEKQTGKHIHLGSAYSTEVNLQIYEAGYLDHDDFDLIVYGISDMSKTLDLLNRLRITYVKPEVEAGATWRVPKQYSVDQLRQRVLRLPCRFNLGAVYFRWDVLNKMKAANCMKYELVGSGGFRNEI